MVIQSHSQRISPKFSILFFTQAKNPHVPFFLQDHSLRVVYVRTSSGVGFFFVLGGVGSINRSIDD